MPSAGIISLYARKSIVLQFLLAIASGLPLALTSSTLTVWLSEAGVSKASIGIFAAVALPYSIKFLWAPLLDGIKLPFFGKRLGWIAATQIFMAGAMALMAFSNPQASPWLTGFAALLLAFFSASHDVVKDAYRVEILTEEEQGAGAAAFVFGYRIGMILSTAGALYLATYTNWQTTYLLMGVAMLLLLLPLLMAKEPAEHREQNNLPHTVVAWLRYYVVTPFREFLQRPDALLILSFILLYRMADAFLGIMANPFYIELGFSKTDIAEVVKLYGLIATLVGSAVGGAIVFRLGIYKSLWIGELVAGFSNLMFIWQAHVGAEKYALAITITTDNLSGGIATAAMLAFMAGICNRQFTATQFALLTSLSAVGRSWLSTPSGWVAETFGWSEFFIISTVITAPSLIILWCLRGKLSAGSHEDSR